MNEEVFELGEIGLALPTHLLHRVELVENVLPVPGTRPPLVGIAESGGRIVTLLDPGFWGGKHAPSRHEEPGELYVLTLAEPYANLALLLGRAPSLERRSTTTHPLLDEAHLLEIVNPGASAWR